MQEVFEAFERSSAAGNADALGGLFAPFLYQPDAWNKLRNEILVSVSPPGVSLALRHVGLSNAN